MPITATIEELLTRAMNQNFIPVTDEGEVAETLRRARPNDPEKALIVGISRADGIIE